MNLNPAFLMSFIVMVIIKFVMSNQAMLWGKIDTRTWKKKRRELEASHKNSLHQAK